MGHTHAVDGKTYWKKRIKMSVRGIKPMSQLPPWAKIGQSATSTKTQKASEKAKKANKLTKLEKPVKTPVKYYKFPMNLADAKGAFVKGLTVYWSSKDGQKGKLWTPVKKDVSV